jgi:hypothetical protein
MKAHDIDPPALRSVAIFNLTKKVANPADMPEALQMITAPLWSRFEQHQFLSGGSKFADSAMAHSVGVDGEVFVLSICTQLPVSYEWTVYIDRMPPLWKRLLGLPPAPLRDTPATRRLLSAIDEGLRSEADVSRVSWHKKEVLSHQNLSSAADSPF